MSETSLRPRPDHHGPTHSARRDRAGRLQGALAKQNAVREGISEFLARRRQDAFDQVIVMLDDLLRFEERWVLPDPRLRGFENGMSLAVRQNHRRLRQAHRELTMVTVIDDAAYEQIVALRHLLFAQMGQYTDAQRREPVATTNVPPAHPVEHGAALVTLTDVRTLLTTMATSPPNADLLVDVKLVRDDDPDVVTVLGLIDGEVRGRGGTLFVSNASVGLRERLANEGLEHLVRQPCPHAPHDSSGGSFAAMAS